MGKHKKDSLSSCGRLFTQKAKELTQQSYKYSKNKGLKFSNARKKNCREHDLLYCLHNPPT